MNIKYFTKEDSEKFLLEHIIRGDTGDGVCNIKSPSNSLVIGKRQKSVFAKEIEQWVNLEPEQFCDAFMLERYQQNKSVIDLSQIPVHVQQEIMHTYSEQGGKDRSKLFNYFVTHKLKLLVPELQDF